MWNQIKQHPWAVGIAALIHLLLLAFFVVNVDWHREVGDTAEAVEAEMVGDPKRIAEIQKQMENPPPPTPEQLREEQRLEEERQKQIEEEQRLVAERQAEVEEEQRLQDEQRQAEQKQLEEEQRLADLKQQEDARLAEEKIKAEQAVQIEKERARKVEKEQQRQAEIKRQKEAEKKKQRQAEVKRKAQEKQKKIAEEKRRKEDERQLREAEMQAEAARFAGAMEAEEASISAARRSSQIKQWENSIKLRVRSKWLEPPGGASGECRVEVVQARTGTVLDVQVVPSPSCDSAMQKSVARAVRRADPLPRPKDPSIFDGRINFTFKPEQ